MISAPPFGPPTPMESWWVPIGVLLGTVAVATALMLLRRRGGRPRHRAPIVVILVVGLLATGLLGLNSYAGYVPTPAAVPVLFGITSPPQVRSDSDVPRGRGSHIVSVRLGSRRLAVPAQTVYVYLPPGYRDDGARRFPVLYLYGGWPGRSNDWLIAGRIQAVLDALLAAGRIEPMIVVMPDTTFGGLHDTECLNAVDGPRLESFLAGTGSDTVPGYLDRHFRTIRDRRGRAFAGMSSGGFCALNMGLHHTGTVSVLAALEPYAAPGAGPESDALHDRSDLVRHNRILQYVPTMRFAAPVSVLLCWPRRAADAERRDNVRMAAALRARGQHVVTRTENSWHTWHLAQLAAPAMLEFVSARLARPAVPGTTPR